MAAVGCTSLQGQLPAAAGVAPPATGGVAARGVGEDPGSGGVAPPAGVGGVAPPAAEVVPPAGGVLPGIVLVGGTPAPEVVLPEVCRMQCTALARRFIL